MGLRGAGVFWVGGQFGCCCGRGRPHSGGAKFFEDVVHAGECEAGIVPRSISCTGIQGKNLRAWWDPDWIKRTLGDGVSRVDPAGLSFLPRLSKKPHLELGWAQ